jgi:putative transposase
VVQVFLDGLQTIRDEYGIRLYGFVVMPEHVHLVLHPPDSIKLGLLVGRLKSKSASRIIAQQLVDLPGDCVRRKDGQQRQAFWQTRCYDHNCRTPETVIEKIRYCHNNPVKRGLVLEPGQWPWSSYNWYAGHSDGPLAMDEYDSEIDQDEKPT